DEHTTFVIADLPGLIAGAAVGKGLGHRFLRHTERTRLLLHLVDLDPTNGRDPVEDWQVIQEELEAYSPELAARPQVVAANQVERPGTEDRCRGIGRSGGGGGLRFHAISAVTGRGLAALVRDVGGRLTAEPWPTPAAR